MQLRLAYFAAGLAEKDVIIGVRIKWRVEVNEIDALIGEFFRIPQPGKVIAEIESSDCSKNSRLRSEQALDFVRNDKRATKIG